MVLFKFVEIGFVENFGHKYRLAQGLGYPFASSPCLVSNPTNESGALLIGFEYLSNPLFRGASQTEGSAEDFMAISFLGGGSSKSEAEGWASASGKYHIFGLVRGSRICGRAEFVTVGAHHRSRPLEFELENVSAVANSPWNALPLECKKICAV